MGPKHRYLLAMVALASVVALLPSSASAATTVSLVASGLDSPRGVVFIGHTAVVAEAGHGSINPADCFLTPFGNTCVGNTSQISWFSTATGAHSVLASGFFSITLGHEGSIGVSGLAVRDGKLYAQIGATGREVPPTFAVGQQAGNLISVNTKNGKSKTIAHVGNNDFDYTKANFTPPNPLVCGQCPGTQESDANPNAVLATSNGWLVADSGANTLTKVSKNGKTTIVYHFPFRDIVPTNFPNDEVPTCVASTDAALWVGTLAGHLYRLEDKSVTPVTPKDSAGNSLLSHVTGCTSRGESLYLVNMFGAGQFSDATFPNGSVVKYDTESGKGSLVADAFHNAPLFLPYSPQFGPDGNLYVTAGAVCNADGTSSFGAGPLPCTIGGKVGGRLVKITMPRSEEND